MAISDEFKTAELVDRISIRLSKAKEDELSYWITMKKNAINVDRERWKERQKKYLFSYDDFITFGRKGPWEGSSNYHMPFTAIMVKSYHSRLYNIFAQEDTTSLLPRESMDENSVEILKRLRSWYLWDYINEYRGIKGVAHELFMDVVTVGFGVILKSWELKQRKALMLEKVRSEELGRDLKQLLPEANAAIAEGKKVSVKPYREVQKIITVFEGTRLQTIPYENIWFPNDCPESTDMDHPELVLVSTKMTATEIGLKGKQGLWKKSKVEKAIEEMTESVSYDGKDIKELRDRMTGDESQNSIYPTGSHDIEYAFC